MTRLVSAEEARGMDYDAVNEMSDGKRITTIHNLAATVIALSEEQDLTQEHVIRLTKENVNLLRWQSVAADAHLDHLCAMVMSLAASDEVPRALRSISAEGVVTELRRAFDAERVNRAKSEAESIALRKAAEDIEGRALDAEKERDRLRAILACERGEKAPEGWTRVSKFCCDWENPRTGMRVDNLSPGEWQAFQWRGQTDCTVGDPQPTALEAIEAAPTLR